MHAIFIPYGDRTCVELMLRNMEAQKHKLKMWKDGKEKTIWINGHVRILPFGVVEYCFPREDGDAVLHTLDFDTNRYGLTFIIRFLRKLIRCDKVPKYKKDNQYLWIRDHVNVIPIGVKEDGDIVDPIEEYRGWTHEAI